MERTVINIAQNHFNYVVESVTALGGGFYGRAFLIKFINDPNKVVAILYLYSNLAENEANQIETLAKSSILKMPHIFGVYLACDTGYEHDVVLMEYFDGFNAGWQNVSSFSTQDTYNICENIVDNLISIHSTINKKGFGEINSTQYYNTWQDFYRIKARSIVCKARELHSANQISDHVLSVFEKSFNQFDNVFYLPITEARLIHGDYNTWNIMLNKQKNSAMYVIDPFGCCYGDSEYDLYQLDNANGIEYGLLKRYAEKVGLSPNFEIKKRFYRLYSEICHYYDAHVQVDYDAAEKMANDLEVLLL